MALRLVVTFASLLAFGAPAAFAQKPSAAERKQARKQARERRKAARKAAWRRGGPYLGVVPGAKDIAPGKYNVRSRGAIRYLTWVGFQMVGVGGRVFIQTNEPAEYSLVPSGPDSVVLEFPNTRLQSRNDGRKLDTRAFPTAIRSVDADRMRGNTTRVTISLRENVGYDMRQEGNYIFLDFRQPSPATLRAPAPGAHKKEKL